MKIIILITCLLVLSTATFSQQTNPSPTLTKQDYLQKSKHQKTAAWLLLLGGFGLEVTAFATAYETEFGATLLRTGFLANLVSIPFFIMAHRNKKKGMRLSFKNETIPQIQKSSFVYRSIPSLTFKINL